MFLTAINNLRQVPQSAAKFSHNTHKILEPYPSMEPYPSVPCVVSLETWIKPHNTNKICQYLTLTVCHTLLWFLPNPSPLCFLLAIHVYAG